MRGVPRGALRNLLRRARVDGELEQPRAPLDDEGELVHRVEVEPDDVAEAREEGRGEEAGASRGADERERLHGELDGRGEGPLARHDVDAEVLHRRVEALLDDGVQPVDLVDEEDVVRRELREQPGERPLVLDDGAVRHVQLDPHLVREDLRERRLAEPGRAAEEHVVERLLPAPGGLDEDAQVLLVLGLADVVVEGLRAERAVEARVVPLRRAVDGARVGAARLGLRSCLVPGSARHGEAPRYREARRRGERSRYPPSTAPDPGGTPATHVPFWQ